MLNLLSLIVIAFILIFLYFCAKVRKSFRILSRNAGILPAISGFLSVERSKDAKAVLDRQNAFKAYKVFKVVLPVEEV